MKKWLLAPFLALGGLACAQTVTPSVIPHQTFFDSSGAACSLCTLSSFAAGTTTPLATYTDSSGTTPNTNPIVLDIAGGANIWVSNTQAYKFVLKDALGTTIWTVDNVKSSGGGAVPCSTAFTIQFANSSANALACDPTITIDPAGHSINIGGAITGPAFTLKNLSAITAPWTLDVTSPATALASFGAIPFANLANASADTVLMNASASPASPSPATLPTGCTLGVNYSTSSHTWSCVTPSAIPLSSLANQAADTLVMNASPSLGPPTAVVMPTGCTVGVNYSTATHAWSCLSATAATCAGGACYRVTTDGTTEEWGTLFCGSVSCTVNFPLTFPSTTNLAFNVTTSFSSGNLVTVTSGLSASSVVVTTGAVVYVGGSGTTYSGGATYAWHAIQHN